MNNNYDSFEERSSFFLPTGSDNDFNHSFQFKKINTYWIIILQLTLLTSFFLALFIPFDDSTNGKAYNIIVIVYIVLWVLLGLFYCALNYFHKKERSKGYLLLFRATHSLSLIPPLIWAIGVALIAILFVFLPVGSEGKYLHLPPINLLQIFVGVELLLIYICDVYYIYTIYMHNKRKPQPDAAESLNLTAVNNQDNIIEQQAEQIRYLQEARKKLGKVIADLNHRLDQSSDYSNEGNISYELAKKDEEIRALMMRCNKLEMNASKYNGDGEEYQEKSFQLQKAHDEIKSLQDQLSASSQEIMKLQLLFEMEKNTVIELQNKYEEICIEYEKASGKKIIDQTVYDQFL